MLSGKRSVVKRKTKEILGILLILLLTAVIYALLRTGFTKKTAGYDILFLGDSRIVGAFSEKKIPEVVEKETGLRALNGALGGTTVSAFEREIYGESSTVTSGVYLSKLLGTGNLSVLLNTFDSASDYQRLANRNADVAKLLAEADISGLKYVVLAYGVNDCLAGVPVDDPKDPYNEACFGGALRAAVKNIGKAFPKAKVIIVTPAYFFLEGAAGDCNELTYGGGFLKEYSDCALKIAGELGVPVVDGFGDLLIDAGNYREYLADGLHFNDAGVEMEAGKIAKIIKGLEEDR